MQGYDWAPLLELSGESHHSPVNASTTASRPAPHDSGPEWIAAPFLYRTFIDYPSPVSLALHASGPTPLALIRVDVYRTAPYSHGASRGRSDIRSCWQDARENSGRWAARRPRATRERPSVPPRSKSLWRSFPNCAIFRILHRHMSSGADGFNLPASRNQWRFPLISLW